MAAHTTAAHISVSAVSAAERNAAPPPGGGGGGAGGAEAEKAEKAPPPSPGGGGGGGGGGGAGPHADTALAPASNSAAPLGGGGGAGGAEAEKAEKAVAAVALDATDAGGHAPQRRHRGAGGEPWPCFSAVSVYLSFLQALPIVLDASATAQPYGGLSHLVLTGY